MRSLSPEAVLFVVVLGAIAIAALVALLPRYRRPSRGEGKDGGPDGRG